jgi:glutathione S-transferase
MVLHIADAHPEANLLPSLGSSERARVYRWLFYAVANLYESYLRFYYSGRFADDATAASLIKQTARLDIDKYWDLLEKDMAENYLQSHISNGPYLLGSQYSVIDPYLLMLIGWHQDPRALLDRCPCLSKLFDAVRQRPAVGKIWGQNTRDSRLANW